MPVRRDSRSIEALARAHGVATSYVDASDRERSVPLATVEAVLAALGVNASSDDAVAAALADAELAPWRRVLPAALVVTAGGPAAAALHLPEGARAWLRLEQADGASRPLVPGPVEQRREVGRRTVTRRSVPLPADMPAGYHGIVATVDDGRERQERSRVVVAPPRCPAAREVGAGWGWLLQLYALRSRASWGVGDLGDLRDLAVRSGRELGAAFVVCNPLHAVTLVPPLEPSPYYPSSRRFANPLYLKVEDLPEFAAANHAVQARVRRLAAEAGARNSRDGIDRDAAWRAKSEALELLRGVPPDRERRAAFAAFRERGGEALRGFATFCALAERHGRPWQRWPDKLRHPRNPAVATARDELSDRVTFHAWLQFCLAEQVGGAQRAARGAGMPIGIVHDVAVGVDPGGADAWALQDDLATGVTVGAPPDPFNQQGQDWRQPPLRPDRLVETGYAAFRDVVSAAAGGGGLRVDHVLGLFRQWWIPEGHDPADGTYVSYPARDLLAVLALEAARAGAIVVGEDLGTVEDRVRDTLASAGVLSSRVVYFERDRPPGGQRRPPREREPRRTRAADYPREALASVTTHDLPTVAGWWTGEDVRLQADLGLLAGDTTPEAERDRKARERAEMVALLREEGLLGSEGAGSEPGTGTLVDALHAFLARTAARLVAVQPGDAIGDLRQPNMPGTVDEYPNWRLPVAEPTRAGPRPILLDEFLQRPGVRDLAAFMNEGRAAARSRLAREESR